MSSSAPIPSPTPGAPPIRLRPELSDLGLLTGYIEEFGIGHGFSPADTHAFTLAAEELFANTLSHSRPPATLIQFALSVNADSASAVYADDGAPFDPTSMAEADTTLPASGRAIGGLGIHFIRKTMPTFRYERRNGQNRTTFGRPLTTRPQAL